MLDQVVEEGLTEKVTCEQRPDGGEGACHRTSGKHVPGSVGGRELVNVHSLLTQTARLAF